MLVNNQMLFPVVFSYREEELRRYSDIDFLIKYMEDHYKLTQTETLSEIYNNR